MRLHRLRIEAFGPFATATAIDFDALGSAGLFLLSGPTGAGKSSVLDAVCFALYGDVPGERSGARHLRSDAAAPDSAPRVELELTLSQRRLRLTRSPAWDRPKRRGEGTTRQQATVLVEQRDADGSWTHLANRMDEAGHLVSRLLGLTLTQFCQVVLLPQGGFQQFLRADAKNRQRLLQSIFRTSRFGAIERWLSEQRLALRTSSLAAQRAVSDAVSRISETAQTAAPPVRFDLPAGDPLAMDGPGEDPRLSTWARDLRHHAHHEAQEAEAAEGTAHRRHSSAVSALEDATRLTALRTSGVRARRQAVDLARRSDEIDRLRARRDEAVRAAPVGGFIAAHSSAVAAVDTARRTWAAAISALGPAAHEAEGTLALEFDDALPLDESRIGTSVAQSALSDLSTRRLRVEDEARTQAGLDALRDRHAARSERLAALQAEGAVLRSAAQELPLAVERARTDVASRAQAATMHPAAHRERAGAVAGRDAARQLVEVEARLAAADADHEAARVATIAAKETWLDLAERRVLGMASELAHQLAVGSSCPVCGSCEHPAPAAAVPGAPDAVQEKAARRVLDDAEFTQQTRAEQVRSLREQVAVLRTSAAGRSVDEWSAAAEEAERELDRLTSLMDGSDAATSMLAELRTRAASTEEALRATERAVATLGAEHDRDEQEIDRHAEQVSALLAAEGADTVAAALAMLDDLIERWSDVLDAAERHRHRVELTHQADAAAAHAALDAGFETAAAARDALVPHDEMEEFERELQHHDDAVRAAEQTLSDPDVAQALEQPPHDLDALQQDRRRSEDAAARERTRATLTRRRADRLTELVDDLDHALTSWEPIRAAYDVADTVATLASGRSSDNAISLTLSAYVVAWRLGQVVAAANERLGPMTAQRYALEQRQGGLDIDVRDEWTGESRDPATLSGGETFLVSLSLALGLADVVLSESAADADGSDLETLFVDEGFGALDAETLDDVMGVLDGLRDGGRVVGVVSHVSELRTRIGTHLQVTPGRAGSTTRIVHAVT